MNLLRFGSRGSEVLRLQELLNKHLHPHPRLKVDGIFGPRTEDAVRYYQASVGIGIDGVAGIHTLAALDRGLAPRVDQPKAISADFTNAPWLSVAMRELGQAQLPKAVHNPRILEYHASTTLAASTDETAWCSSFVNWCLQKSHIAGTNSAAASSWLHWGSICGAKVGAITVIHEIGVVPHTSSRSGYHVGFWIEDTGAHFQLLGGNQSKKVKISSYPKSLWEPVGHRWPKWQRHKE